MKGPWESRVGMLLDPAKHADFVWSFKSPDSALYGGQPRIDWLACDIAGGFWMIEVKQLAEDRRSLNLLKDVSAGQRQALDAVVSSDLGMALLAVGWCSSLYIFDWRRLDWRNEPKLLLTHTRVRMTWTGPKMWADHDLYARVSDMPRDTPPILPRSAKP